MTRLLVSATFILTLCASSHLVHARPPAHGGGHENRPPQGDWSEKSHSGKETPGHAGGAPHGNAPHGNAPHNNAPHDNSTAHSPGAGAAAGHAAENNKKPQATGAQGAAAGAAASNRNNPTATGAQGAAAGAAAANRNKPDATGAQGAAAGAAVANRNNPKATGAQGAAAGAAVANRNQPELTGAQGAAAGAAVANRNAPAASGAAEAAAGYTNVRNSFNYPNVYNRGWYGEHPTAWVATGAAAGAVWTGANWASVANYAGYNPQAPISYDYGVNVVSQGGNVLVNGQNVGTTAEYAQQAADLAELGDAEPTSTDEWLPLGVFAMVRNEQDTPQLIVQLAINKDGILRGNYTDEVTDTVSPIHGAVDKETQRAAWTVGNNKQTVMEMGVSDLTDRETPALIHKRGKTDHWILVRLDQPKS